MRRKLRFVFPTATSLGAVLAIAGGCQTEERIVDIQTPAADVEVNRDTDSGKVEIDISDKE